MEVGPLPDEVGDGSQVTEPSTAWLPTAMFAKIIGLALYGVWLSDWEVLRWGLGIGWVVEKCWRWGLGIGRSG